MGWVRDWFKLISCRPRTNPTMLTKKSGKTTQNTPELQSHSFNTGNITPASRRSPTPVRLNRPHLTQIGFDVI